MTLLGAYHPEARPLEQRRLALDVVARGSLVHLARAGCVPLDGVIHAEGIAVRAACVCTAARRGRAIRFAVDFASDEGVPCSLVAELPLDRWTSPRLTELRGHLSCRGAVVGPATLRIDWRRIVRM